MSTPKVIHGWSALFQWHGVSYVLTVQSADRETAAAYMRLAVPFEIDVANIKPTALFTTSMFEAGLSAVRELAASCEALDLDDAKILEPGVASG